MKKRIKKSAPDAAKRPKNQIKQVYVFSLVMVVLVVITIALSIWYLLMSTEVITLEYLQTYGWILVLSFILGSVLLSVGLTYLVSILVLRPVNVVISGIFAAGGRRLFDTNKAGRIRGDEKPVRQL